MNKKRIIIINKANTIILFTGSLFTTIIGSFADEKTMIISLLKIVLILIAIILFIAGLFSCEFAILNNDKIIEKNLIKSKKDISWKDIKFIKIEVSKINFSRGGYANKKFFVLYSYVSNYKIQIPYSKKNYKIL